MENFSEIKRLLGEAELDAQTQLNDALFPLGRERAFQELSSFCDLSPVSIGSGPIDKTSVLFWKLSNRPA
ncbi:hypothetical protein [Brucella sp. 22210]|uniref:hypothetical protein n=1 Tax=Brucella sp. 22210 TaxID=3453892 RepID=UPI003F83B52F